MGRKNTWFFICGIIAFFGVFLFPRKVLAYSGWNNVYVQLDANGDCVGESGIANVPVNASKATPTSRGNTDASGHVPTFPADGLGDITITLPANYALSNCPNINPTTGKNAGNTNPMNVDFGNCEATGCYSDNCCTHNWYFLLYPRDNVQPNVGNCSGTYDNATNEIKFSWGWMGDQTCAGCEPAVGYCTAANVCSRTPPPDTFSCNQYTDGPFWWQIYKNFEAPTFYHYSGVFTQNVPTTYPPGGTSFNFSCDPYMGETFFINVLTRDARGNIKAYSPWDEVCTAFATCPSPTPTPCTTWPGDTEFTGFSLNPAGSVPVSNACGGAGACIRDPNPVWTWINSGTDPTGSCAIDKTGIFQGGTYFGGPWQSVWTDYAGKQVSIQYSGQHGDCMDATARFHNLVGGGDGNYSGFFPVERVMIDTLAPDKPANENLSCSYSYSSGGNNFFTVNYTWQASADTGCAGMHFWPYWAQIYSGSTSYYDAVWGDSDNSAAVSGIIDGVGLSAHVQSRDALDNQLGWTSGVSKTINCTNCSGCPTPTPTPSPVIVNCNSARVDLPGQSDVADGTNVLSGTNVTYDVISIPTDWIARDRYVYNSASSLTWPVPTPLTACPTTVAYGGPGDPCTVVADGAQPSNKLWFATNIRYPDLIENNFYVCRWDGQWVKQDSSGIQILEGPSAAPNSNPQTSCVNNCRRFVYAVTPTPTPTTIWQCATSSCNAVINPRPTGWLSCSNNPANCACSVIQCNYPSDCLAQDSSNCVDCTIGACITATPIPTATGTVAPTSTPTRTPTPTLTRTPTPTSTPTPTTIWQCAGSSCNAVINPRPTGWLSCSNNPANCACSVIQCNVPSDCSTQDSPNCVDCSIGACLTATPTPTLTDDSTACNLCCQSGNYLSGSCAKNPPICIAAEGVPVPGCNNTCTGHVCCCVPEPTSTSTPTPTSTPTSTPTNTPTPTCAPTKDCTGIPWSACSKSCPPGGMGTQTRTCRNTCGGWWTPDTQDCCTSCPPGQADLSSPANSAIVIASSVDLTWTDTSSWGWNCSLENDQYKVYISNSSNPGGTPLCTLAKSAPKICNSGTLVDFSTYYWKVTKDNGDTVADTDSDVWSFTTSGVWTQVFGGDVYKSVINQPVPTGQYFLENLPYQSQSAGVIISTSGSGDYGFGLTRGYQASGTMTNPYDFSFYKEALKNQAVEISSTDIIEASATDTTHSVYLYTGKSPYTLTAFTPKTSTLILLVDGTLNINSNINFGTNSVVLIVRDGINIGPNVTILDGLYITSATFTVASSINTLTVNGMVYADGFNMQRTYISLTDPTYIFNYQPKYQIVLLQYLGRAVSNWQEVNP